MTTSDHKGREAHRQLMYYTLGRIVKLFVDKDEVTEQDIRRLYASNKTAFDKYSGAVEGIIHFAGVLGAISENEAREIYSDALYHPQRYIDTVKEFEEE